MHASVADHLRAIALFRGLLERVTPLDLARPTPCAGWTVRDLLAHQLGQDLAFTAALRGGSRELRDWLPVPIGDDASAPLLAALDGQQAALRELGDPPDAPVWMPEILATAPLPAPRALAAHLLDLVVHSWDLGASIGAPVAAPADLVAQCLAVARAIPDTAETRGTGRAFAPVLRRPAGPAGDAAFEEMLLLLGRDPGWTRPGGAGRPAPPGEG